MRVLWRAKAASRRAVTAWAARQQAVRQQHRAENLVFPAVENPAVSVVIPVHNKLAVTWRCLTSLVNAQSRTPFEVIVVDDASTDGTAISIGRVPGITVLRNERNLGFVHSCNRGAALARGDYITFLNNDTEPEPGWLDEMLAVFRNFADVGLVGSRLVYPDGTLQEAGGIVWSDGEPWNYGRGQAADRAEFSYTRLADYLSGAAITVDRRVWQRVRGFSREFAPAYFEDTDLAFKVRKLGKKTVYAPLSVVVHREGTSSGTDTRKGMKRFQDMNAPVFSAKWARALEFQPKPGTDIQRAANHWAGTKRVLFVDEELPQADCTPRGYEAIQDMRLLQSLGYHVTLVLLERSIAEVGLAYLQRMGVEVTIGHAAGSLASALTARGSQVNVAYLNGLSTSIRSIEAVRRLAPGVKIMSRLGDLGYVDPLLSASDAGRSAAGVSSGREEVLRAVGLADVILSPSVTGLATILGDAAPRLDHVAQAPYVVDVDTRMGSHRTHGSTVGLWGDRDRPADREAIESFIREVMPLLREGLPAIRLRIYGSGWRDDRPTGLDAPDIAFDDAASFVLGGCRIAVLPQGSGMNLPSHAVDGLIRGIPLVLSADRAALVWPMDGVAVCTGPPRVWAEAIIRLCADHKAWAQLSEEACHSGRLAFTFERGQAIMRAALAMAGEHAVPLTEALVTCSARPDWQRDPGVVT